MIARSRQADATKNPLESGLFVGRRALARERIWPELNVHSTRLRSLAALHQPRRAVAAGAPQATQSVLFMRRRQISCVAFLGMLVVPPKSLAGGIFNMAYQYTAG